jgi:Tfp pilus assembly protein FimT
VEKSVELRSETASTVLNYPIRNSPGFTLVELAMILAVMAVFLAFSIPNMLAYRTKLILRGAGLQVSGDLTRARMEAIKQNCNIIISFNSPTEYSILVDTNCDNTHNPGETCTNRNLDEKYPGVKNIKVDTKNIFNSRGAMNRMRNIILQNQAGLVNISISLSGRIKLD